MHLQLAPIRLVVTRAVLVKATMHCVVRSMRRAATQLQKIMKTLRRSAMKTVVTSLLLAKRVLCAAIRLDVTWR